MKALVVDDSRAMRMIIRGMLAETGIDDVVEAADGAAALRLLAETTIDLVITDVHMTGMDGWELVTRLRAATSDHRRPVILVSTDVSRRRARSLGAAILPKPFDQKQLAAAFDQVLSPLHLPATG